MGVARNRPWPWDRELGRDWNPPQPAFDHPHPMRMRDYLLGGKDNYQADRDAADATLAVHPGLKPAARAGEDFLGRALAFMADPRRGLTQYLHLGAFIPTLNSYDSQVRQQCPEAAFAYVTDDAISAATARGVLAARARPWAEVSVLLADFREPGPVLRGTWLRERLDLDQPVGVVLVGMLDFTADDKRVILALTRLRTTLAPGSMIVMLHALDYPSPAVAAKAGRLLGGNMFQYTARPLARVRQLVSGFDFVGPGFVPCDTWSPEGDDGSDDGGSAGNDGRSSAHDAAVHCAVAGGVARI